MMRMTRYVPLVLACLFLVAPAVAAAQETRGSIEGVIKDNTGGVLPGVTVNAKQLATNSIFTAVTDAIGVFRFPALTPGAYSVTATLQGFKPETLDKVEIILGQIHRVNLILSVAGIAVSETVRAESPIVDTRQNSVTQTVTKDLIALLPNSTRDFHHRLCHVPCFFDSNQLLGKGAESNLQPACFRPPDLLRVAGARGKQGRHNGGNAHARDGRPGKRRHAGSYAHPRQGGYAG